MTWAEAALEEMGLAQRWVRRGQRVESAAATEAPAAVDEPSVVAAATVAQASQPAVEPARNLDEV